jgi:3',5'-cyclic AMP phosphodiesterase CpdA
MLIAQISDLHLRPPGVLAYGVAETNAFAEQAVNALLRLRPAPDLVILTGDATDCGLPDEFALLTALLDRLPMPVFCVPGNHDRREAMRAALAPKGYLPADGALDFVVETRPVRVVGLDSLWEGHSAGRLEPLSLAFLADTLAAASDVPTIVAVHHPPFVCGIGHMDRIRLLDGAERFAAIVAANPQVERVVTGHHHRPVAVRFAGTICQIAPSVAHQVTLNLAPGASSDFVLEPPAFLLHQWIEGTGLVTHQAYVQRAAGPFPFVMPAEYPGGG